MSRRNLSRRTLMEGLLGMGIASTAALVSRGETSSQPAEATVGIVTESNGAHLASYLESLQLCQGVKQIALADPSGESFERATSLFGSKGITLRTFRDYRKMLEAVAPDLALVTLEPRHSPEAIETCLQAKCHVATEKPACVRVEDFAQLVRTAAAQNRQLMLALANRLGPPAKKAVELVRKGFLGKPYGTSIHLIADQTRLTRPSYQTSWRAAKSRAGGGHLLWLGIHYLDLIQYITGDSISQVSGLIQNVGGQPIDVEDAAVASLQFKGGAVGTYHGGYYLDSGYQLGIKLWGSQGWLHFDPLISPLRWYSTLPAAPRGIQTFEFSISGGTAQYLPMVQNAVDVARGVAQPFITAEECLQILRVVFSIYRAADTGRRQIVE